MIRPSPTSPNGTRLLVRPLLSRTPLSAGPVAPVAAASRRAVLVHRGRTALWHGLRALGLGPGDRVLFPAYCCGAELEVLLHAGLQPVFYPVDAQAVPDPAAVAALLRRHRPRVLYLIHYFGLPVPLGALRATAREQGMLLIEDCAHALFALDEDGSGIGSAADLAIFSLPKHLPAPNGGLMVLPGDVWVRPAAPQRRTPVRVAAKSLAYVLAAELEHRLPGAHDRVRRLFDRPPPGETCQIALNVARRSATASRFDPDAAGWDASVVTRLLVHRADGGRIRERRRCNYGMLAATLNEHGPIRLLRPPPPRARRLISCRCSPTSRRRSAGSCPGTGWRRWRCGETAIRRCRPGAFRASARCGNGWSGCRCTTAYGPTRSPGSARCSSSWRTRPETCRS